MAIPTTRQEFKDYCLRKLGAPVIEINVDDDQVEDRIDEAIKYFNDYHYDGAEKLYYKHQVTQDDVTNKYIDIGDTTIIGITRIFQIGLSALSSNDIFSINYQIALNDMYNLTSMSMIPYYLARTHLQLIQELLVGQQSIRFNKHTNKIYVDMDWNNVHPGMFLIFEAYKVLDPEEYSDMWSDRWLQNYATVLIQEQWGRVLTKFTNVQLSAGGNMFNGTRILDDAQKERAKLEEEMIYTFSLPAYDFVG